MTGGIIYCIHPTPEIKDMAFKAIPFYFSSYLSTHIFVPLKPVPLLKSEAYWHFRLAAAFSLILAVLLAAFITIYGKHHSFLIINGFNSPPFDFIFRYFTYLGDGMVWIPLLVYVFVYKRKFLLTVILAFIICTVLIQFCKWVIFADALRPLGELKNQIRMVPGEHVHRISSFPSGHTSIAFTYALLMAFLLKRLFWTFFFPLVAFFVGYSRIYLAQHFVTDVFAGILVGMASAFLALIIYERLHKIKAQKKTGT
ncbi:MAG TPA: phosphatase PAP2 family protein [Flavisolibacter sp.]|nr:phosphatase PAP2 family protein [Flavisolibacter sp.]